MEQTNHLEEQSGDERQFPLSSDLIQTIQQGVPAVLKHTHVSLLKQLAKSASEVDIRIQVRDGVVSCISHTLYDFTA